MKKRATQKRTVMITASTKMTMIFCACTVGLALLLFLFLILFPIKVDNPKNGINEKLIASATTAPMVTTPTTETTESFSNTRQTTDRNRVTTTTKTETLWEAQNYDDSDYDNSNIYNYNNDNLYNDYSDFNTNNNDSNHNYNDYTPVQTEPPAIVTDAPIPDEQPDIGGDIIDVPAVTEIVPEVQDEFSIAASNDFE